MNLINYRLSGLVTQALDLNFQALTMILAMKIGYVLLVGHILLIGLNRKVTIWRKAVTINPALMGAVGNGSRFHTAVYPALLFILIPSTLNNVAHIWSLRRAVALGSIKGVIQNNRCGHHCACAQKCTPLYGLFSCFLRTACATCPVLDEQSLLV